jgi:GT2 family glycosyltransferase
MHKSSISPEDKLIAASLVDHDYYTLRNEDVARSNFTAKEHYICFGWLEERSPNPLFDIKYYKNQFGSDCNTSALELFLKFGSSAAKSPHPLFDYSYYLNQHPRIANSKSDPLIYFISKGAKELHSPHRLFDVNYYLEQLSSHREEIANPLFHYLTEGYLLGFNPHPLFDTEHYLAQANTDEVIDYPALVHYVLYGAVAGRSPHPLFDPIYYCKQTGQIDDPLQHFLCEGWRLGYNPHPKFEISYYLEQNPDVAQAGVNPLEHFILHGAEEKRSPCREYPRSFMHANSLENDHPRWRLIFETPILPAVNLSDYLSWRYKTYETQWVLSDTRLQVSFEEKAKYSTHSIDALIAEINDLAGLLKTRRNVDVSIVVPVHNKLIHSLTCLRSIFYAGSEYSFEVLIADDGSNDATQKTLAKLTSPVFKVLRNGSAQGFLKNCNGAAAKAKGDWLVLLNNDTIVLPGWLDELIDTLVKYSDIGLVGAKLIYPDGSLQECGGVVWRDANAWNIGRSLDPRLPEFSYRREVDYCSGALIALSRLLWEEMGGFDERYSPAYYEDTDLAFRVREKGLKTVVQPLSSVVHFEGISHGKALSTGIKRYQNINRGKFLDRWKQQLKTQPHLPKVVNYASLAPLKKSILVVDAETPRPDHDSGSNDTYQYIQALLQFGYHVIFVAQNCQYMDRYTQSLQRCGVECLYAPYTLSLQQAVKDKGVRLAAVLVFRHYVARELIPALKTYAPQARIVLETVDLHFLREARQAKLAQEKVELDYPNKTRLEELAIIDQVDATILLSQHEMRLVRKLLPNANLYCIPILRENPAIQPKPLNSRKGLMFLGGFRHPPNVDGICWFVEEIWPLLIKNGFDGNLMIVGADPPKEVMRLASKRIRVLGHVEKLDDVFSKCRITVAPLRYGAGLKGKIISSLSYGVPCVSTPIGIEGSGLQNRKHVLVGKDAKGMADQILSLYYDDVTWLHLAENGKKFFEKRYSTQAVFPKIRKLLDQLGI